MTVYNFFYADRMRSVTSSTGVDGLTLTAGSGPWRAITKALVGTKKIHYCIVHENGLEWEVGRGQMDDGDIMYRDAVLSSSNAGAAVDFTAGEKEVFITLPADTIKNIQGLGERNGIPACAPSAQVVTTTASIGTIATSQLQGVREFTVCAYGYSPSPAKSKAWRVVVTQLPNASFGVTTTVDVQALAETETLPWSVTYNDTTDQIEVTGAASQSIRWYVFERVLGRFE